MILVSLLLPKFALRPSRALLRTSESGHESRIDLIFDHEAWGGLSTKQPCFMGKPAVHRVAGADFRVCEKAGTRAAGCILPSPAFARSRFGLRKGLYEQQRDPMAKPVYVL